MSITRTTKGYTIRWYDRDGRERQRTYKGVDRQEAAQLERKILAERDRGEAQPDERQAPTFGALADQWIEENRPRWKPSTRSNYEQLLTSHLRPAFGDTKITNVTDASARQLVTKLHDAGLGARRINLTIIVLKMVTRSGRRFLREDPLAGVKMLREPATEIDPLTPDEVDAFLAACPKHWRPYFTAAFYTGARPGELIALKWGDVDANAGRFRIRAARYRGVEGTPKTPGSVRDVDMLPPVVDALRVQKAQQAGVRLRRGQETPDPEHDYVFTGRLGGPVATPHIRGRVWAPTLKRAGLRQRAAYQTRHTFASNALAAGENPTWVSAMLGHKSAEMLFEVYARWIPNRTRRDGSAMLARMIGDTGEIRADVRSAGLERR